MFLAVGTGAYVAAIFHMITHAFFKALLFLGSGSVIHGMHDEQDMRRMGGLRKFMPITAGHLHHRLAGHRRRAAVRRLLVEGRDPACSPANESPALWVVGLVTALLTAFYMSRQVFMTFFGRPTAEGRARAELRPPTRPTTRSRRARRRDARLPDDHEPHESPWPMMAPLVVLAGLAVVGGVMQPAVHQRPEVPRALARAGRRGRRGARSTVGTGLKWLAGRRRPPSAGSSASARRLADLPQATRATAAAIERPILARAWRIDDIVRRRSWAAPARRRSRPPPRLDTTVIDGAVNGVGVGGAAARWPAPAPADRPGPQLRARRRPSAPSSCSAACSRG